MGNCADLGAGGLERDAERVEHPCAKALALANETEKDVLGPDETVTKQSRLFLRVSEHSARPVGEAFEHSIQYGAAMKRNSWSPGSRPGA